MANGFQGSKEEWDRVEAPLRTLDPVLDDFAESHGLEVIVNDRGRPNRTLGWERDGIARTIEIALQDETFRYELWVSAWFDEDEARWGKSSHFLDGIRPEELRETVPEVLEGAFETVDGWRREDLEPHVDLAARRGGARFLGWILFLIAGAIVVWGTDWILELLLGG